MILTNDNEWYALKRCQNTTKSAQIQQNNMIRCLNQDVTVPQIPQSILEQSQARETISKQPGDRPIEFRIRRDGAEQTIAVTPYRDGDRTLVGLYMKDDTRTLTPADRHWFYMFIGVVENLVTLLVIWTAWRWPRLAP